MEPGRAYYDEVGDQPAFAAHFDMAVAAERCPSFARFVAEIKRLVQEVAQ